MQVASRRRKILVVSITIGLLAAAAVAAGFYLKGPAPAGGADTTESPGPADVALASNGHDPAEAGPEKKTPIPVNVAPVGIGDVSSYISSTANLVSENEVKVLGESEGRVAELLVEEGHRVRRGQVLATLAREDAQIALQKAEIKTTNARMAHDRAVRALAEQLMSQQDFDKLRLDMEIAVQELAEAKWRLEKTTIRSPFDGRVVERGIRVGQHIRPGDPLFTVADFDPLIARIYLPEKDVFGLKEGRDVRITMKANEAVRFDGRIRQISPVVDTATGTVKLTIEASNPPAEVRPGAFVTIDIVRETHARAVLIPREAIVREMQDAFVFVASGDVARRKTVSLGLEEGGKVEALGGVAVGEEVIVAGQGGLKDGSPIRIIPPVEASDLSIVAERPVRG